MKIRSAFGFLLTLAWAMAPAASQPADDDPALQHSVEQLRSSVGLWNVTTQFLNPDGSTARTVTGTYRFNWVVPDRVLSGTSDIPELEQVSAILFFVNPAKRLIQMVSVGADGRLWIMSGALGEEVRTTEEFATSSGGTGQLRFTRYNVSEDRFESKMEYTEDGGRTWQPGNHQQFVRAAAGSR